MWPSPNRRDFLGALAAGAAGLALPPTAFAQQADAESPIAGSSVSGSSVSGSSISDVPLGDRLHLFTGAGGNVVVAAGPDGLVLVNGGNAARSPDLLKAIAARTNGARVQALFNTDWHRDFTGSNETLGSAGTTIIAHEHTKQYLGAEIYVVWQDRTYKPLPPRARPTQTFYTSGTLTVGAERVEYGHLGQAHTDAAIYVFFPGPNVLIAGDALSVGKYPIPDYTTGGWLSGLIAANTRLLAIANADTRIVPGTGPLQTRADLQAQKDMLAALMDRFVKMMKQGMGPDDVLREAPTREFDATWGTPDVFVPAAYRSLWLHVRELGGIV